MDIRNFAFAFAFQRVRISDVGVLRHAVAFYLPLGRNFDGAEIVVGVFRKIVAFGDIQNAL